MRRRARLPREDGSAPVSPPAPTGAPASPNVGVDIDITAEDREEPETVPPLEFDIDSQQDDLPGPGRGRS